MTDAPRPLSHWNAQLPDVDRIGGNIYENGTKIICNSGPMITYAPPPDVQVCGVVFSDLENVYPPLDACVPDSYIEIIDCIAIHRAPFRHVPDFDAYIDCLNEQGARIPVGEDGYRGGGAGLVGTHGIDGAFCWQMRSQGEDLGWFLGGLVGAVGVGLVGAVGVLNRGFFGWGRKGSKGDQRGREKGRDKERGRLRKKLDGGGKRRKMDAWCNHKPLDDKDRGKGKFEYQHDETSSSSSFTADEAHEKKHDENSDDDDDDDDDDDSLDTIDEMTLDDLSYEDHEEEARQAAAGLKE